MALLSTAICAFDTAAVDFALLGIDGKTWSLQQCKGDNGAEHVIEEVKRLLDCPAVRA